MGYTWPVYKSIWISSLYSEAALDISLKCFLLKKSPLCLVKMQGKRATISWSRVGGTKAGGKATTSCVGKPMESLSPVTDLLSWHRAFLSPLGLFLHLMQVFPHLELLKRHCYIPWFNARFKIFSGSWTFYLMTSTRLAFKADPVFSKRDRSLSPKHEVFPSQQQLNYWFAINPRLWFAITPCLLTFQPVFL